MMQQNYEDRVIAFIDILGFRKIVERTEKDDEEFRKLLSLFQRIEDGIHKLSTSEENDAKMEITVFSDSIAISTPRESFDIFVTQLLMTNIWMVEQGFFIRGGIAYGKVYHRGNLIFGPAIIEAYDMERKLAFYPRIIIAEETLKKLKPQVSTKPVPHTMADFFALLPAMLPGRGPFTRDCDGLYYVDYVRGYSEDDADRRQEEAFRQKLEVLIENNIEKNKNDPETLQKMQWIKSKLVEQKMRFDS